MKTLKGKNILVTGGTGFVGSHLVEELLDIGVNVVTTTKTYDPFSYFQDKKLYEKTTMCQVDICDFDSVFDVLVNHDIEYVFHLAAQALVETAYYNPRGALESNILGTVNVLESARLYPKIKGVIVASSDKAYGKLGSVKASKKKGRKYKEKDALRGDHPYEVSKSSADLICTAYYKTYSLPVVITRFGNIYGEGDLNFSRIIPGALKSIIKKETLEIRSDGTFIRDYLYVKDVVRGYLMLADNLESVKGQAFNFGSKETFSVLKLLRIIEKKMGKNIKKEILNTAKNEIPYQSLDYSKIEKAVGWAPKATVSKTTPKILSWYRKYFKKK